MPEKVWENIPVPEAILRFLFAATVVSPFKDTAPVPVPKVPLPVWVRLELFCTVTVPFEVNPEVAVIKPEMVGVAVQAVPVTVRFPPNEVKLLPETVKVLSRVVAPCKVNAPGVVVDPMVLIDEAPDPKVLVKEAPVPMVELPDEVKVVNAPVEGVLLPIVPGMAQVLPNSWVALILPLPE